MTAGRGAISTVVGAVLTGMVWAGTGWAEPSWVQIEAQPSQAQAEESAREWAGTLPDVAGFAMSTGWYAITLGPYDDATEATDLLRRLRAEGLIPRDSYVSDGKRYRDRFFPTGAAPAPADAAATPPAAETVAPEPPPATVATPEATIAPAQPEAVAAAPVPPDPTAPLAEVPSTLPPITAPEPVGTPLAAPEPTPVETLADSRRLEAQLDQAQRMEIQSALNWAGFYNSAIDGAFGRGTRGSISAWQEAMGFEPTGVLASAEQAQLLETVAAERAVLGLAPVEEKEAGIGIDLPLGLVEFDRYDPPFVQYRARGDSGVTVLLISEPGDQNTLFGLYDVMQTLEMVPMTGERARDKTGFHISGQNEQLHSWTEAHLSGGLIKGFTLVWPAQDDPRMGRVLDAMKASFRPLGNTALDPTLGKPMAVARGDLVSGLDVRHPVFARSGFFIDAQGAVLTAAAGLGQCDRVTIEDVPAEVALLDEALGIAVLRPKKPLAPASIAAFETMSISPGSDVTVAGFSYPEVLSAPVLSFGTLSDLSGLAGETDRARLALRTLPGDAGGPVLDGSGAVLGLVLPRAEDPAKLLPEDLTEAVQTTAMVPVLAEKGFAPVAADTLGTLATEDISALAQGFTVQIACWK